MNKILKVKNVEYSYQRSDWSMGPVSFEIEEGEFVGIVGPNGSGKSTFVKLAGGILKADKGQIVLKNENMSAVSRRDIARVLGYLPQSVESVFNYKVEEVVAMGRYAYLEGMGFLGENDLEQIHRSMELTEIKKYAGRYLNQLSGGEKQRVLLASVLCQNPEILVLDEPTTGLDMHHQVLFFELLGKLSREGLSIVTVTHDLNLAGMFCDRLMLVQDGKIAKTGSVEEVINKQTLDEIYPGNVYVSNHPVSGTPIVLPLKRGAINE